MGLVLEWSTPAVLRMEGLSRCGLKAVALMAEVGPLWRDSAARAVKKPTGGSASDVFEEWRLGVSLVCVAVG